MTRNKRGFVGVRRRGTRRELTYYFLLLRARACKRLFFPFFTYHLACTTVTANYHIIVIVRDIIYLYTHAQNIYGCCEYAYIWAASEGTRTRMCVPTYMYLPIFYIIYRHANPERVRRRRRDKTIVCAIDPKTRRNRVAECEVHIITIDTTYRRPPPGPGSRPSGRRVFSSSL